LADDLDQIAGKSRIRAFLMRLKFGQLSLQFSDFFPESLLLPPFVHLHHPGQQSDQTEQNQDNKTVTTTMRKTESDFPDICGCQNILASVNI
jgi:hypothetical protein